MATISNNITAAAQHLQNGELVGIPTETVYGLAGNGLSPKSLAEIFRVKARPAFDPLILHAPSWGKVAELVTDFPEKALQLAKAFWPGPLTLVLPKAPIVPDLATSGLTHVAVRVPQHPLTLALLNALPFPLAAPSANPFGFISPTTAQHVDQQLGKKIPFILDGGPCQVGLESTIVSCVTEQPIVLRKGGLPIESIEKLIGKVTINQTSSSKPDAPGMLQKHYSPTTPFILGDLEELMKKYGHQKLAVIAFEKLPSGRAIGNTFILSPKRDLAEAAGRLFSFMRKADALGIDLILAETVPEEGLGRAINDRLRRAAAK